MLDMFDIYLLIVPLLVLPIVLLFVFVGCTFEPNIIKPFPFRIFVKFDPPRQENFTPVVNILQNVETLSTLIVNKEIIQEPNLPDRISQFELSNKNFDDSHFGPCTISCRIYLDNAGSPIIGPVTCDLVYSDENRDAIFIVDSANHVTTEC